MSNNATNLYTERKTRNNQIKDSVIVCTPDDSRMMTPTFWKSKAIGLKKIDFVRALVKPGDNIIDIGANYGVYSLAAAKRMEGQGNIWAFEPCSETASYLRESIGANISKTLRCFSRGLGKKNGWAEFNHKSKQ